MVDKGHTVSILGLSSAFKRKFPTFGFQSSYLKEKVMELQETDIREHDAWYLK